MIATETITDLLQHAGYVGEKEVTHAMDFHERSGISLVKILLNFGYVSRKAYYKTLGKNGYVVNNALKEEVIDLSVAEKPSLKYVDNHLAMPLRIENGEVLVAMADPTDFGTISYLANLYHLPVKIMPAEDLQIIWLAHKYLGTAYVKSAVFDLLKKDPANSAVITFTDGQLLFLFVFTVLFLAGMILQFVNTSILINILLSTFFLIAIGFKLFLSLTGSRFELHQPVTKEEVKQMHDEKMPVYTILLPVYKESEIIKKLIWNLQSLDYPKEQLDIKLLIEEDDSMTLNAVRELDFPAIFEVLVIPYHMPKTKPKACNYGLHFSRGKYLTIYDAEDIPDSDQLKKVVALFEKLPEKFICIQSALNYFNRNENFFTRMFTLEYSYWFDYMLPGLGTLDIPIPLGGTSNHFKMDYLVELGAWDPFNVTEDADLGVRAYAKGYKVAIINSTTYEEANNEFFNWIRQRSRWIKGYMQTYLVHMRHPGKLIKKIGWKGFIGFNFFIGATPLTFLIYPILLVIFLIYLFFSFKNEQTLFPDWVHYIAILNFIVGNLLMIYVNMMAVFKRRLYDLIVFALCNPIYWLMHSIAAYKGLWQLIVKPFYWEKTNHGLSKTNNPAQ